ncbi:MAG: acyl carrier protein [Acidobacteriota bacterium]|nr:MAG: acyl carrier protein [Acidobacteriota bacterium]
MNVLSYEEVCRIVSLQLGVTELLPGLRLVEDLGAQSADFVNIVARLEEFTGRVLEDDEIAEISTLEDLWKAFREVKVEGRPGVGQ